MGIPPDGGRCRVIEHTADLGLRATGRTIEAAFAALADGLGRLTAEVERGTPATATSLSVTGRDLPELAFAWLNELIGQADERRAAIAGVEISPIHGPADEGEAGSHGWHLAARVRLVRFGFGARPRTAVKSATYHGLEVRPTPAGWVIVAYLDV